MFSNSRIKEIDNEILQKRNEAVADSENVGNSANVRKNKREAEIENLESERQHILHNNSWKSKILWSVIVPIAVTVVANTLIFYILSNGMFY